MKNLTQNLIAWLVKGENYRKFTWVQRKVLLWDLEQTFKKIELKKDELYSDYITFKIHPTALPRRFWEVPGWFWSRWKWRKEIKELKFADNANNLEYTEDAHWDLEIDNEK